MSFVYLIMSVKPIEVGSVEEGPVYELDYTIEADCPNPSEAEATKKRLEAERPGELFTVEIVDRGEYEMWTSLEGFEEFGFSDGVEE